MRRYFFRAPEFKRPGVLFLFLLISVLFFTAFIIIDKLYPVNLNPKTQTCVILAKDGTPLRSFADANGVWRYPVTVDEVSPYYIEALLGYEDRWFYYHPGINPFSLLRASFQLLTSGKVISGGSTLTMQVARLKRPVPKSISGKLRQIFTAFQLEWHFKKDEILNYYLNHAPFGGTFEGVQAASYAYFDHGAKDLTHAQAALLAVMPQAPSRYRPDRYPTKARQARDKLLERLGYFDIWPKDMIEEAKEEQVTGWPIETKMNAPLLARRLHSQTLAEKIRISTLIDYHLQIAFEQLAMDYAANLPPHLSVSILAMNNQTGGVEAYVGSADFLNESRFGHVDMVKAIRSPGSTIKPFIYGMALDQGLIHSQSMLMDIPILFGDYQPVNFNRSFSGPVSVAKALSQSLNLPAVQLFDHLGPRFFYARMINSGFKIKLPQGASPNLSMALGGFAASLEDLLMVYSCLGRGGETIKPRFTRDSKIIQTRLLSKGAAWIIHETLVPERGREIRDRDKLFAVKTGTSYGFRDAWALGVDKGYTVGVWVGRPDGTPVPGHYGAQTATPLLKMAFQLLPRHQNRIKRPDSVTGCKICWPGGQLAKYNQDTKKYNCKEPRNAWMLDRTAPKTLTSTRQTIGPAVIELNLQLTKDRRYRIPGGCNVAEPMIRTRVELWPKALESWLPTSSRRHKLIPPISPGCPQISDVIIEEPIAIEGITDKDMIIKKDKSSNYPVFDLKVQGGNGPWYWFENSIMKKEGKAFKFAPQHAGQYQLLVVDQSGAIDQVGVEVF
ncbi:MAG: penicillin-binding protein 1C [Proteobacteria bacterium]|nr:penicillin-binding protein 1C [Pseudomonadota bacterium]